MNRLKDQIFWTHFTDEGGDKLIDLISDLRYPDTLDQLGLSAIRLYYADSFFPGMTTIMTRARYFLFVSALYRYMREKKYRYSDVRSKMDGLRKRLTEKYEEIKSEKEVDEQGIIGRVKEEDINRLPDDIYWNGIRKLGIFNSGRGRQSYLNEADTAQKVIESNDKTPIDYSEKKQKWDGELPYEHLKRLYFDRGSFREGLMFGLDREERKYLKSKLLNAENKSDIEQLYAVLLEKRNIPYADNKMFWEAEEVKRNKDVINAKKFSILSRGLWLNYYYLLLKEKSGNKHNRYQELFEEWHEEAIGEIKNWDFKKFLDDIIAKIYKGTASKRKELDRKFLEKAYRSMLIKTSDTDKILKINSELIKKREADIKQNFAKLTNKKTLNEWDGKISDEESRVYHYDYKWNRPVRKILNDVIRRI